MNLDFDPSGLGGAISIHSDIVLGLSLYDLTLIFVCVMAFAVIWKWFWVAGQRRETVTLP